MRNRTLLVSGVALVALLGLSACSTGSTPIASGDASSVSVGLLQQARSDQEPWSAAWTASAVALEEANAGLTVTETFDAADPTKAEPVARQLLDQGADVLVMSSFLLADVTASLAAEYPEVPMLVTSFGEAVQPNLWLGTASYLEIGYATCWYLTSVSEDGRMGVVAALDDPAQAEVQQGCALGAAAANPAAAITTVNTNSYTDQQASREQTQKLLDNDITSIYFVSASAESLGGFALCEQTENAVCSTWGGPATDFAPNAGEMYVELDWSVVMQEMVDQAASGQLESEVFNATFANGGLRVPEVGAEVAQEVADGFAAVIAGLADESIELPDSAAHPGLR